MLFLTKEEQQEEPRRAAEDTLCFFGAKKIYESGPGPSSTSP